MSTLARVTAIGFDDVPTTHPISIVEETPKFLTGWVVDNAGARTDKLWVIDQTCIVKRSSLRINRTYATLEVDRD